MDRLPIEMIDQIIGHLKDDPQSSKNLRLTARGFHRTTRNIFHTLVLYLHPEKWENLDRIARSPSLAGCVRTVKLARIHCPYARDNSKFKAAKDDFATTSVQYEDFLGTITNIDDHDKAYAASQYWYSGYSEFEKWFDEKAKLRPVLQLDKLSALDRLESIGHEDLKLLNRSSQRYGLQGFTLLPRQEKELELTRQEEAMHIFAPDRYDKIEDEKHLDHFLLACYNSGKRIDAIALHDTHEMLGRTSLFMGLPIIKTLEIDLSRSTLGSSSDHRWFLRAHQAAFLQPDLSSIELLVLTESLRPRVEFGAFSLLRRQALPALKNFTIKYATHPPRYLQSFIHRHKTLKMVTIDKPRMEQGAWKELCEILGGNKSSGSVPRERCVRICLTQPYNEKSTSSSEDRTAVEQALSALAQGVVVS